MGAELNTAHGNLPDENTPCNHVRVELNKDGVRVCRWCRLPETEFDFDPADHPDAGGPAGR